MPASCRGGVHVWRGRCRSGSFGPSGKRARGGVGSSDDMVLLGLRVPPVEPWLRVDMPWRVARLGVPGHHRGHPRAARLLDRRPTREQAAVLLPDRGARDRHLPHRGRRPHASPGSRTGCARRTRRKNAGLYRLAFKMATGSGKTVVMAMLIAWQTLNKLANPQDRRFTDTFLVVTPGITIRDRLRVLLPELPGNYYRRARPRDARAARAAPGRRRSSSPTSTPSSAARSSTAAVTDEEGPRRPDGDTEQFKETPAEMVRRVCRPSAPSSNIVVLNDEAHHCYQSAPQSEEEKLTRRRADRGEARRGGGPRLAQRPAGGRATRSASGRSTTCRPRRSSCGAPGTPRARSSPGSCRTSASWTRSSRAS